LSEDLNVPGALGEIFKVEARASTREQAEEDLKGLLKIAFFTLGLDLPLPPPQKVLESEAVAVLAAQRSEAKKAKDFAKADELRREIETLGYKILDGKDGGYHLLKN